MLLWYVVCSSYTLCNITALPHFPTSLIARYFSLLAVLEEIVCLFISFFVNEGGIGRNDFGSHAS
jgi:cytochrome c biogenesis factor